MVGRRDRPMSTSRRLLVLVLTLAPGAARAQVIDPLPVRAGTRYTVGAAGVYAQPLGEFGRNVRQGFGLDGFGTLGVDSRGIFRLRAELGYLQYSSKTEEFFLSTGGGFFELESQTKSGVLTLGVGPQLMAPAGPIRPYAAATVGFARYATETSINIPASVSNTGNTETLDKQTVSSDFVLSLAGAGGLAFELNFLGRGVLGDLGVRYHRNGQAKYVTPEGVQYNGTGTATVMPTESEADFLVYRIGIVVPLR